MATQVCCAYDRLAPRDQTKRDGTIRERNDDPKGHGKAIIASLPEITAKQSQVLSGREGLTNPALPPLLLTTPRLILVHPSRTLYLALLALLYAPVGRPRSSHPSTAFPYPFVDFLSRLHTTWVTDLASWSFDTRLHVPPALASMIPSLSRISSTHLAVVKHCKIRFYFLLYTRLLIRAQATILFRFLTFSLVPTNHHHSFEASDSPRLSRRSFLRRSHRALLGREGCWSRT